MNIIRFFAIYLLTFTLALWWLSGCSVIFVEGESNEVTVTHESAPDLSIGKGEGL